MADSLRKQILTAARTALSAPGGPEGLQVIGRRSIAAEAEDLPEQEVYSLREDVGLETHDGVMRREFLLVVLSKVASAEDVEAALDPLLSWAVSRLTTDAALLDLVREVTEVRTEWNQEAADTMYGEAYQAFRVVYATQETDLSQPA